MLAVVAKRDGQWRVAGMLFGRWFFAPNEVFDSNNATHKEVQGALDQIAQAADRKDAELLRPTLHPQYRLVGAVPDQPEAAVLFSAEDVLRNVDKGWKTAGAIRYRDRIAQIHVRDGVALAQTERWFEMDGTTSHSFLLFLFCRTNTGWKQALEITGDWRRLLTEEAEDDANTPESRQSTDAASPSAKDTPDLCRRIRDALAQRDVSPSRNLIWPDCYMSVGPDDRSLDASSQQVVVSKTIEPSGEFLRSVDEIVPLSDPPVYEVQGPLAVMQWKKARLRIGDQWHTVEGLEIAIQRDGEWRSVFGMEGDWLPTASVFYDPNNADHAAIKRLRDQAVEAMVQKDASALRALQHPDNLTVTAGPAGAQVFRFQDQITDEELQKMAVEQRQETIAAMKVLGPLAVTLCHVDQVSGGRSISLRGHLNIYGRTDEGWRFLAYVAGDWSKVLMAESGIAQVRPAVKLDAPAWTNLLPADAPPPAIAPFDATQATKHQADWAEYLRVPAEMKNCIGMKMALIPPGEFLMGGEVSPQEVERSFKQPAGNLKWYETEHPQHTVRITKPFYMGVYEVTQAEYVRVMGNNPSAYASSGAGAEKCQGMNTDLFPVDRVGWDDAIAFCAKLTEMASVDDVGGVLRLPTEAEWEYACRAGTTTAFHFGSQCQSGQANCNVHSSLWPDNKDVPYLGRTTTVGSFEPNAFGLFDVHGNVSERCLDWYDKNFYGASPTCDPLARERTDEPHHVIRGGSYTDVTHRCRAASRRYLPSWQFIHGGFRVVMQLANR